MPWRGPNEPGEFPTLGHQVIELVEAKCVIPDGERAGEPFVLTDEMVTYYLWVYRINPDARYDERTGTWRNAFYFPRGDQICRPQKWGKGPLSASRIVAESHDEAPVLFAGWDENGEPIGKPWPTPWVQVTAYSEDQAMNVWKALLPMVREGPLADEWPDTGDTRINLPSGGLIEPVTSSAQTRKGQRVTFPVQDQTEDWTQESGGRALADTQRNNAAGMGGRFHSACNAWDPTRNSVAQYTAEQEPGVYLDDIDPGSFSVHNKRERQRALRKVYGDSARARKRDRWVPWVDLDRIDAECAALVRRDPAQAKRNFCNAKEQSAAAAFDPGHIDALLDPGYERKPGRVATIGVDGAQSEDALAIVGTLLEVRDPETHAIVEPRHHWPIGIWEHPPDAPPTYLHPTDAIDAAMVEAVEHSGLTVARIYVDPDYINHLLVLWQGRWGKRVQPWKMNRPTPVAWAVRNFEDSITGAVKARAEGEPTPVSFDPGPPASWDPDADPIFVRHLKNARRQPVTTRDDTGRLMHAIAKDRPDSPRKMDGAAAAVLSDEAANDCIAAGEGKPTTPPTDLLNYRIELV